MKIKLIDLLNMIYENKLKENTLIKASYSDKSCEYWRYINNKFIVFYDEGKTETTGYINVLSYLKEKNFTVEIIEEDKPIIEKINLDREPLKGKEVPRAIDYLLEGRINEIIDYINRKEDK